MSSQSPLHEWFDDTHDESDLAHGWTDVRTRLDDRRASKKRAVGVTIILAAVAVALVLRPRTPTPEIVDVPATAVVPQTIGLEAGTRMVVMPGSSVQRIDAQQGLRFALRHGRVAFSVAPRSANAPFIVEAGATLVQVVGTRFAVQRVGPSVLVEVEEGRVRVLGDGFQARTIGRRQRLLVRRSGEAVEVREGLVARASHDLPRTKADERMQPPVAAESAPTPGSEEPPVRQTQRAKTLRKHAPKSPIADTAPAASPGTTPATSLSTRTDSRPDVPPADSVAERLARADSMRANKEPEKARALLQSVLTNDRDDPQASTAAFMLARIELEDLDRPVEAACHFEEALALGLPVAIAPIARARVVQAWVEAKNRDKARAAAQRYLQHHPNGRRSEEIRRWAR